MIARSDSGYTLIEIVIVVAITGMLATLLTVFVYQLKMRRELDGTVNAIAAVIRDAQQKSITQEDFGQWGVYLEQTSQAEQYALIRDSRANIIAGYRLPGSLTFQTNGWTVNGPMVYREIIFTPLDGLPRGEADVILEIRLRHDVTSAKTITIAANGTVSY